MLISEFACAAGLKSDTVRYYVKRGLLRPEQSTKGGQNPYHIFADKDLEEVLIIRVLKVLGLSLKAIQGLLDDRRRGRMSKSDQIAFIEERRQILLRRAEQMRQLILATICNSRSTGLKGKPGQIRQTFRNSSRRRDVDRAIYWKTAMRHDHCNRVHKISAFTRCC